MNSAMVWSVRAAGFAVAIGLGISPVGRAQGTNEAQRIDLVTVLRLAGTQNIEVQIARERLAEAQADHGSAIAQLFPWVAPGIGYRRHDGNLQDVAGNITEVHKQSYAPGGLVGAQLDLGEAIYKQLATKQEATAASHGLEAQRQESAAGAALAYFDLLASKSVVEITSESVRLAADYEGQVQRAVEAGIAFKGEQLRVRVQRERNQLAWQRALADARIVSAKLAQTLRLNSTVELLPSGSDLVPMPLIRTNLMRLIAQALAGRSELKQSGASTAAARELRRGATYGPLVPTVGALVFWGGLGGGRGNDWGSLDGQEDYSVSLSWRLGAGGLLDLNRQRAAQARLNRAQLSNEKLRDEITRQVVEAVTQAESLAEQLAISQGTVTTAEQGYRLAQQRKEFGVGIVLEALQAEQELTRARLDYARSIAEFNKAQYALLRAVGGL
ncbi:MAG: TolC family protein [Pedosphaera sp.]|nr:TolC family protein [Pedosphaera sp.]